MRGAGRTLRVSILGVKVQEARRYHVVLQVLAPGQSPAGVVGLADTTLDGGRPSQIARTETSAMSSSPEFLNRVFVMRLPEPLAIQAAPGFKLQCNLFASPTMQGSLGQLVAGQEIDELIGASTLQVGGEMANRLIQGERVTLPVVLSSSSPHAAEGADGLLKSLGMTASLNASMFGAGGKSGKEVLLELMLVDSKISLPRDEFALRAASAKRVAEGDVKAAKCTLMVLVSRAENLPLVRGANGQEVAPTTFVAAKLLKDTQEGRPAQRVTRVSPQSHNPSWGQLLQIQLSEDEVVTEKLHLGIVNDENSKLMIKGNIPLRHFLPGVHYSLKLLMAGGPMGSSVALFVTLCLTEAPKLQLRRFKQVSSGPVSNAMLAIQAKLSRTSRSLEQLAAAAGIAPKSGSEVFAIWRLEPAIPSTPNAPRSLSTRRSMTRSSPQKPQPSTPTLTSSPLPPPAYPFADTSALVSDAGPPTQPTTDTAGEGGAPVAEADEGNDDHGRTTPPPAASVPPTLPPAASLPPTPPLAAMSSMPVVPPSVEVDLLYCPVNAESEDACSKAIQQLSEMYTKASAGGPQVSQGSWLDAFPVQSWKENSGGFQNVSWLPDHTATLICQPSRDGACDLVLELHHVDVPSLLDSTNPHRASDAKGGLKSQPIAWLRVPWSNLPQTSSGEVDLLQNVKLRDHAAQGSVADLEVMIWDKRSYETDLGRKVKSMAPESDLDDVDGGMLGSGSRMMWQSIGDGTNAALGGGEVAGVIPSIMETLVDDLALKQMAIDRVVRAADSNASRCEMAVWRLQDADNQSKKLTADNQHLRQLLHEEKEASRMPQIIENSSALSREELVERAEAALAAFGRERRRNLELVHRLQQMHGEQVDTLELKRRYHELQTAHMALAKQLSEAGGGKVVAEPYLNTIKTQEQVIANLEKLLDQEVGKAKATASVAKDYESLRGEAQLMKRQLAAQAGQSMDQYEKMLKQAEGVHRTQRFEDEIEMNNLQMQLKQTEDKARCIQEEMVDAIKRYAREVADLKVKLAEKDAQLMGGFGDMSRLRDLDDDLGIPMIMMPPSQGTPTGRPLNSSGILGRSPGKPPRSNSAGAKSAEERTNSPRNHALLAAGSPKRLSAGGAHAGGSKPPSVHSGSKPNTPPRATPPPSAPLQPSSPAKSDRRNTPPKPGSKAVAASNDNEEEDDEDDDDDEEEEDDDEEEEDDDEEEDDEEEDEEEDRNDSPVRATTGKQKTAQKIQQTKSTSSKR